VTSDKVKTMKPELFAAIRDSVNKESGSVAHPKMLGDSEFSEKRLKLGQAIFTRRCEQCHGVSGDGAGPVATQLFPPPRDYRPGVFKFTSNPYGFKPRRDDLIRTVKNGIHGTSMPSFARLSDEDIGLVVDYVLMLTHRGEFEAALAYEAETEEVIDRDRAPEVVEEVLSNWKDAEYSEVQPVTPMPEFTAEHVRAGREAFLTKGCSKCHGEDGRGQTKDNIGVDAWGHPTRAADLTSGLLHGGQRPIDVYRRIYSGINGTPMPGFGPSLSGEPETLWNLVAFVLYTSGRRRAGELPDPGTIRPITAPPENQTAQVALPTQ
jgi:mono/diheme cytochrome c family protein